MFVINCYPHTLNKTIIFLTILKIYKVAIAYSFLLALRRKLWLFNSGDTYNVAFVASWLIFTTGNQHSTAKNEFTKWLNTPSFHCFSFTKPSKLNPNSFWFCYLSLKIVYYNIYIGEYVSVELDSSYLVYIAGVLNAIFAFSFIKAVTTEPGVVPKGNILEDPFADSEKTKSKQQQDKQQQKNQ